jgi:hypothetical protein
MRFLHSLILFATSALTFSDHPAGIAQSLPSAESVCTSPAVAATADALAAKFETHQFVFVGSTHGDAKIEEFLMCLVTRPAFFQRVTDIVVEWASSGHQRLLDRYLLALDPVPGESLAPIWFDTDSPTLWGTLPQIRQFVETLRAVNRTLPATKRIRLLGGNEGIDWGRVRSPEDLAPYPFKTNYMEHLIPEHLARTPGNRTLVVYGDAHINHKGRNFMTALEATLERSRLFVVGTIRERVAQFGDPAGPFFVDESQFPPAPFPPARWPSALWVDPEKRSERLADSVDAVLYLGPERDRDLRDSLPLSTAQRSELARREAILSDRRRAMEARFKGRDQWFRTHPNDVPPRP